MHLMCSFGVHPLLHEFYALRHCPRHQSSCHSRSFTAGRVTQLVGFVSKRLTTALGMEEHGVRELMND